MLVRRPPGDWRGCHACRAVNGRRATVAFPSSSPLALFRNPGQPPSLLACSYGRPFRCKLQSVRLFLAAMAGPSQNPAPPRPHSRSSASPGEQIAAMCALSSRIVRALRCSRRTMATPQRPLCSCFLGVRRSRFSLHWQWAKLRRDSRCSASSTLLAVLRSSRSIPTEQLVEI